MLGLTRGGFSLSWCLCRWYALSERMGHRKREPGERPGLPRSGEWERPPSKALFAGEANGKRRPVDSPARSGLELSSPVLGGSQQQPIDEAARLVGRCVSGRLPTSPKTCH
jgi:hypothetical protein